MSLDFSFERVKDHAKITTHPNDKKQWHPVAGQLPWIAMICGFRDITAKNLPVVCHRVAQYQGLCGAPLFVTKGSKRIEVFITDDDLERFIGFSTNASPISDADWRFKLARMAKDAGDRHQGNQQVTALELFDAAFKREAKRTNKKGA